MRIIHITNHFLPSPGGVEWSVLRTAEAQARRGDDIVVLTETPAGKFDDTMLPFRIVRFQVPVIRPLTRLFYWRYMWSQRALFRSAYVLHFHDYTPLIHWFLPLRAVIRSPLYAITFHGFEHWPVRRRHRMLRALAASITDVRFAVGEYVRRLYAHPVDAVYLGAPVRAYERLSPAETLTFAFAGRLESDTGIDAFASVLATLANERRQTVHLEIAGEGSLRSSLTALSGEYVHVHTHGRLEDPLPLYTRSRFVIATGFLAMFEAFQTGLPVLAPALTEVKRWYLESLPEAGELLTPMTSVDEMRSVALRALSADIEAEFLRRAENAIRFVSERSWDDIACLLSSHYGNQGSDTADGLRTERMRHGEI
jgi:glycosyltransferase involved in cell wall biosynthesis